MFGNPTVMPTKILWDYLVYWSITGFIFFHGRMCEQTMYLRNLRRLDRLGKLNHFMQDFFRQWHAATDGRAVTGTVNVSEMPIIREMNQRLKDELPGGKFFERFEFNAQQLVSLANEIVTHAALPNVSPMDCGNIDSAQIRQNAFQSIFDNTKPAEALCHGGV